MEGSGSSNWRPPPQADQSMAVPVDAVAPNNEWRSQLPPEARHRIVSKIMDTLRKHLPISAPEGLGELNKIAVRFEEKIYNAATCQADYLRKISMKMLTMEQKNANPTVPSHMAANSNMGGQNAVDTAGNIVPMHSQVPSMSIGISSQPPAKQILATNLQSNIVSTEVSTSTPAPPSVTGMNQSTINIGQNPHLQATPAISQNSLNNSAGQGVAPNLFASAQRQLHGRLQQPMVSQQQQQQSQNQLVYQQQQLLKQKVPHPSLAQPQMSQSQKSQSLLPASLQPQQTMISMPSGLQTSSAASLQNQQSPVLQSVSQNLQQNQQNPVQQGGSIYASQTRQQQMPRQSVLQQQASSILQQSSSFGQQPGVLSTQQQLFGQQSTMTNMAQRHFGQQNIMSELQQQQHPRLPTQQNNLLTSQQSQQTLNQQQTVPMHQQQLTSQTNLTVLQQQLPSQQQQQQSSQLPQHQSQLLGSQPSTTNVQQHSQSTHMLQHSKAAGQVAQTSATLMQLQGQGPTQQHVAHLQSQSIQLQQQQQQLSMQQQTNSLREMHPRHPASGVSLQPQTDQQKQETQPQRVLAEAPSTSVDSTSQTSQAGTDMQEEIYQKIRSLKELYCSDLQEMHHKLTTKLLQHESSILSAKQSEQLENLKKYRTSVERMLQVLQLQKGNISLVLKDRLPGYEKQIQQLVASSKKKYTPQLAGQQFQHPGGISQPIQQQTSQISQLQQSDALLNQVQPMNMQTSVGSVQSAVSNMQSGSSTALGSHLISQNPMNSLQPYSNMESSQGNVLASSQQGAIGSLQQSSLGTMHQASINAQQQNSISALMQSTVNTLSSGGNPLQQNSNTLQHQQVKQEQQQQLMQAQQVKQLQQRHLQLQQHQLIQQQQKQQILQQQPQLQQQLLQQKQLQQQVQVQPHQIHQLQQSNEMNPRHPGMKSGIFQSHNQAGHRQTYYQQQIKTSSPFSPQAPSPLMSQHSSPQVDQQALPSLLKSGTPIQSTTPPFIVPSPSTPLAPSPLPGDHEKPPPTISSFPNAANVGQQQPVPRQAQVQSLAVGTPGISASPLLAEFDGFQTNIPSAVAGKSSFSEQPIDRLIKAVKSSSSSVLRCAISDIASVVGMIDRIAGAAPGNGSRAAVGEDLAAMTKCRLQARNFMSQDGSATSRKMKRQISAMPLNVVPSTDISDESIGESPIIDISENEFTATSDLKRPKLEANHALLDEIRDINLQLIDTIVDVADDDIDAAAEGGEGTVVKFSYCAIALSPNLKSRLATSDVTPISPLRLLVPTKYPSCSPIVLDKIPAELTSGDTEDLSAKARLRFGSSLRGLPHVMSLKDMAKTWDVSSREVILEYAQQNGGGSFSSRYGTWENCVAA